MTLVDIIPSIYIQLQYHQYIYNFNTINIYTTSSRFLINGKNTQIFVDRDLKNIHKIIESATQNNTEAHLKNLSVKMAEQLTKLLQARLVDNSTRSQETNELSNPPISSSSSINCIKCKKKYKTKSTYCTEGRHWVHYNCEKLSNKEIENVEQGQNSEYTCNICRNNKAKTSMIAIELPIKRNFFKHRHTWGRRIKK